MADLVDVEDALVALIGGVVYPQGAAYPSITRAPVRIYRGWPASKALDADLKGVDANGKPRQPIATITVFSRPNTTENITRYSRTGWVVSTAGAATLLATLYPLAPGGWEISLDGIPAAGQLVAVLCDGVPYGYVTLPGDDLASVAQALVGVLPAATQDGTMVTFSGGVARCLVSGLDLGVKRVAQLRTQLTVSFWCPTREVRDALARAVVPVLADTPFMPVPLDVPARLRLMTTVETDVSEASNLFRRDLVMSTEYDTTTTPTTLARAVWVAGALPAPGGLPAPPLPAGSGIAGLVVGVDGLLVECGEGEASAQPSDF